MKLVPNDLEEFLRFDNVIAVNTEIREKTAELLNASGDEVDQARSIFEWVRDNIDHTKDIGQEIVTCKATDTFAKRTGICFAKSHLLASMMRLVGIPCGFCYQVFDSGVAILADSMALHGLNAIYLEKTSQWHRIDPRGNREGIYGGFSLDSEVLPFPEMAFLDDCVYAAPLENVVHGLENAATITDLWPNLPSVSKEGQILHL